MGRCPFVREQILEAAFDRFALRGYEAVSTREIAEAAQVGPTSMYRHFPTKEALGRAVYATALPPLAALVDHQLGEASGTPAFVRALIAGLYRAYDERPRALALLVFPPHDFLPDELDPANPAALRSRFEAALGDPDLAAILWGAICGPLQDRFLRRRSGRMSDLAAAHAELVIRLLVEA
jgi:AcrR family transcriptional regulator